ncbi:class I SAM-dependent methyltransferase [Caulobacter sp. 17J80-11]|uniref:class I SAM-dependent methyltransferase n=1 Tax=Caulobacter sp. 17J80-11 TaxID=2763502 RepID=UPI001653522F|nr:class I SAM-dependent methyltransferase [Caulobacter sp. 17J80-11]MBC6980819.1 class I SAM-dependent methyltransferase [Caulobacter sp. 17J80-11]
MRSLIAVGLSAFLLASCASMPMSGRGPDTAANAAAVADTARPEADRARDADRKPAAMLDFAGVKPGMVVVDFWPGGGYFTRILSRAVGPEGRVYSLAPEETKQFGQRALDGVDKLNADPATPNVKASFVPAARFAAPEAVDLVFTAQNYHDLHEKFMGPADVPAFNKAVFAALKPGGVFLVIDHDAAPGAGPESLELHRIDPEIVKREVTAAGFVFEGELDVLKNPADPRTANVFDKSIRGHTSQFVYKFRKPKH